MSGLLTLISELATNVRKHTLNGREYVVADVTILKEGVLSGSKGSLFYPHEEIGKRVGIWNGFPLTANHPMDGDKPISGRSPQAHAKYSVGYLFNDGYDTANKRRTGEVWVDIELANRVDNRIVPHILSGKPINVSTGLFTTDEQAPQDSAYNGKKYTHIARNYQPDHLAILLDDLGACSVRDGCGINVNNKSDYPEACPYCNTRMEIDPDSGVCNRCNKKVDKVTVSNVTVAHTTLLSPEEFMRNELVQWLTTNCSCYKGKEAVLNDDKAFTEADLKGLKDNAEASTLAINALKEIGKELSVPAETTIASLPTVVKNMFGKKDKKEDDDEEKMTPEEKAEWLKKKKEKDKDKPAMNTEEFKANVLNTLKSLSEKEYLENAPPGINALVASAKGVVEEKRVAVINALTKHITNDDERKASILKLKDQSIETLNLMASLIPSNNTATPKNDEEKFLANFFGSQGGADKKSTPTYNRKDVLLPNPSMSNNNDDDVVVIEE